MRTTPPLLAAAGLLLVAAMTACTASPAPDPAASRSALDTDGPDFPFVDAGESGVEIADGDDWSMPEWVRPAANSGYFSEEASTGDRVHVRSVDVSWRQIQPTAGGELERTEPGEAQGLSFGSLDAQLEDEAPFWMRIFASGEDWAPEWVAEECGVSSYGPDYDGQRHLPIWDECVWGHLMDTYRKVFVDAGLAADPRLVMVYVPGAFTWAEYDYEMVDAAVESGDLDWATYRAWYDHAWTDLVELFGEHAKKLVFTGEDYPFGPFGEDDDLLAQEAVEAGMGIRTGITELPNFHLSEAPAYGSRIQPDGHMVVDDSLPLHDGSWIVATENECYTDCGYQAEDPYYSVRQSNLKALQLRMNWIYVVPGPSYLAEYPEHWDWVRLSMGQRPETSPDAWAALRDAEDRYWDRDDELGRFADEAAWASRPYVRNLERWLVQVDEPGSVAHRTEVDAHLEDIEPDNGNAYEGLSTAVAEGDTGFALDVDERFAEAAGEGRTVLKVTYLDEGEGAFAVETAAGESAAVERSGAASGEGEWRTATIALPDGALGGGHRLRIALADGAEDLVVRFVRLVRVGG
ncbi:hypothetical protein [Homoserinibacter sp. YIM 151385]|uniref:hypothetical protein n=1 Tax=Homoserinibacter sp. YIM 151385 TaxID=2985506 RepID=UPI0022F12FFC|nr:hypothetical protein [Homoserinibacter sp. YIM 151385]WBU36746.1 hypothetical protein OF852_07290 [Homoserinibacter sp. YIM 151385]